MTAALKGRRLNIEAEKLIGLLAFNSHQKLFKLINQQGYPLNQPVVGIQHEQAGAVLSAEKPGVFGWDNIVPPAVEDPCIG